MKSHPTPTLAERRAASAPDGLAARALRDSAAEQLITEAEVADLMAVLLGIRDELQGILERAADDILIPDPAPQKEPTLASEVFVELYCSAADLEDFRATLDEWSTRKSVTVNIS